MIKKYRKTNFIILLLLCILFSCSCDTNRDENVKEKKKVTSQRIKLNRISTTAVDYNIKRVNIKKNVENYLKDEINLYHVEPVKYDEEKIKILLANCFNEKIKNKDEDEDMTFYSLENGGDFTYYKNSGGLSYNKSSLGEYEVSNKELLKDNIIKIAEKFVIDSKLFNLDELILEEAKPSMYVEKDGKKQVERYEVVYSKKPPHNIDGFVGTQLGITIEIGVEEDVIGFVSYDRKVIDTGEKYPSKNKQEIKNDIKENYNTLIDADESIKTINISNMRYVLYCDSLLEKQENMVPHYQMIDKNTNAVIVMPAIENEYLEVE